MDDSEDFVLTFEFLGKENSLHVNLETDSDGTVTAVPVLDGIATNVSNVTSITSGISSSVNVITFDRAICDPEDGTYFTINGVVPTELEIGARFIHEMLHAYLNKVINDQSLVTNIPFMIDNPDYDINADENTKESIKEIINPDYIIAVYNSINPDFNNTVADQHVAFYNNLLSFVTDGLLHMNNGEGVSEDYLYYAHLIINTPSMVNLPSLSTQLSTFNINDYKADWDKINVSGAFNFRGCN